MALRRYIATLSLMLLFGAGLSLAQSQSFPVVVNAVRPAPSCAITSMPSVLPVYGEIPWTGSVEVTGTITATVQYTNTTSITTAYIPGINKNNGNITGSISVVPSSKTVTGSSTPQNTTFDIRANVTIQSTAQPGTYTTVTKYFTVTCSN